MNLSRKLTNEDILDNPHRQAIMSAYIGWIIVAIVAGMVAYPMLQIIPNSRQKLVIKLRQQASKIGLSVQIRHPTLPQELHSTYHNLTCSVAYHLPDINPNIEKTYMAIRSHQSNEWFWPDQKRPPVKHLNALLQSYAHFPDCILAIEHTPIGHAIFWREDQPVEQLEHIQHILQQYCSLFR